MSRSLVSRRFAGGLMVAAALACAASAGPLDAFRPASTGVAHADTQSACLGWAPFHDVDYVLLNGAQADFGGSGFSNHAPTSSAVVCWAEGRDQAQFVGTLYNDASTPSPDDVGLHVEWYDTTGERVRFMVVSLGDCWNWGLPCNKRIGPILQDGENLNRVRFRTFVADDETGVRTYSAPQNRYYAV